MDRLEKYAMEVLYKSEEALWEGDPNGEAYWLGYYDGLKNLSFDDQIEAEDKDAYKRGFEDALYAKQQKWYGEELGADTATQSLSQEC